MSDCSVVGWDVGGVNTKVARVRAGTVLAAHSRPFEVQRDPGALAPLLASLARDIGASSDDRHAVTMTAELSQMFRTKREGVAFVLDAVQSAFPSSHVVVYTVDGSFIAPDDARRDPLRVAASNWAATASMVALDHPDALLVDIGTTTTDIIPIVGGRVVATGRTDPGRLASGELVYSGALRTPVEAIVHEVVFHEEHVRVSAESFALVGDVHLWRGDLAPADYTVPTPDGRPASRDFAGERIARVICADREMLDDDAISAIANDVARRQVETIAAAIARVRERHHSVHTAVVAGLGAFIAARAARAAGLTVVSLDDSIGGSASRSAPAAAVALLLDRAIVRPNADDGRIESDRLRDRPERGASHPRPLADVVVKLGGSLLSHPAALGTTLAALVDAAPHTRILIVPGGGPFADAVRAADREHHLSDDAAHWMAVLAMDQYAHLLASRHPGLVLASTLAEVDVALASGKIPVLAPYRWLVDTDPLPHSWDVTSDSISAWVAGEVGASRLVLVKPPGADVSTVVDPYFARAVPPHVDVDIAPADLRTLSFRAKRGIAIIPIEGLGVRGQSAENSSRQ